MISLSSSSHPWQNTIHFQDNNIHMNLHTSKPPLMMLIAPPITTKLFPKLHHHHPSRQHHPKQIRLQQTKPIILTTHNHHRKTHTPLNTASENGGERITTTSDVVDDQRSEVDPGKKQNQNRNRNQNEYNKVAAVAMMGMHLLCVFAPFAFSWKAVHVAIWLDLTCRLIGINLSFHRNLTHKSFKLPKWVEYMFAYCGTHALQGNPIDWVRTHRLHHQYVDTERDPHSPIKGFWFSHVLWMFDSNNIANTLGQGNNVTDLEKQFFYRFLNRTYIAHPIALALLLYALGGLSFIVWGMGVRIVWGYHMTWLVNSVCHECGDQTWDTQDLSFNNGWVGILGYGEGWHNNHHAFEYSARHGLEWWQVDITWYLIRLLEVVGVASDVKLPTPLDIQRKTFPLKAPSSL